MHLDQRCWPPPICHPDLRIHTASDNFPEHFQGMKSPEAYNVMAKFIPVAETDLLWYNVKLKIQCCYWNLLANWMHLLFNQFKFRINCIPLSWNTMNYKVIAYSCSGWLYIKLMSQYSLKTLSKDKMKQIWHYLCVWPLTVDL